MVREYKIHAQTHQLLSRHEPCFLLRQAQRPYPNVMDVFGEYNSPFETNSKLDSDADEGLDQDEEFDSDAFNAAALEASASAPVLPLPPS